MTVTGLVIMAVVCGVAAAGGLGSAGPPSPLPLSLSLSSAVARTLAAGSARVEATVRPASGPSVALRGVTSLDGGDADIEARVVGRGVDAAAVAEVRVTGGRAWLRPPGSSDWTPVDPAVTQVTAEAQGWADLLRRLRPSGPSGPTPTRVGAGARRSASVDGAPASVWLDGVGRIVRVRLTRRSAVLDLRLTDFGTDVVVVPPS
jgi:hypothetical protein